MIEDLKKYRHPHIDSSPIFARLARGEITRSHYLAYLRETYHLVIHTPRYLTIAADRVAESDPRLAAYFRNFSDEETGHELLCVRDINALGEDPRRILSGAPNPGAWGMITQCYFWAGQGNPVALLGEAFATEELGATNGTDVAKLLVADYGIPRGATNFLRVHGSVDVEHVQAAARAAVWYTGGRAQMADIVQAVKMTYRYYSQLFTDVLQLGDRWTRGISAALPFVLYTYM
ncbi:MAG TPA: iron-containing redox enzyme family protein [Candidatus Binatia bacterium]